MALPLLVLGTVVAACLCWMGPQFLPALPLGAFCALGMLIADLRAVRLPGGGSAGTAFAFALPLALAGSPALAGLAALFTLALAPGSVLTRQRVLEFLVGGLPRVAGIAAFALTRQPLAGCLVFAALDVLLPDALGQELGPQRATFMAAQDRLMWARPALCAAALSMPLEVQPAGWAAWSVLVWTLARAQLLSVTVGEKQRRHRLQERLEQASETQGELLEHWQRSSREVKILEVATAAFLQTSNRLQTAQEILRLCAQLAPSQSAAVFLRQGDALLPARWQSPWGEGIAGHEPAVTQAWASGQPVIGSRPPSPDRVFQDEGEVLVWPLPSQGVLYLGRREGAFSEAEVGYLKLAMAQASLGLSLAEGVENLSGALDQQRLWSEALAWLLRAFPGFLDKLDRQVLQQRLQDAVAALFPGAAVRVTLGQPSDPAGLQVPIQHPELPVSGSIEVAGVTVQPLQGDLLQLLAQLAASAWKNVELHAEIVQAQGQVLQAGKLAAVGQLAAGLAHELNTPLASVQLNLDMALHNLTRNPESARQRLESACESVLRSQSLVEGLLFYARKSNADQHATPLTEVVSQTLEVMGYALRNDGVDLEQRLEATRPALANHNELQQVVSNLLINARDAVLPLPSGQRKVLLATRDHGDTVQLLVRDAGPGVPADLRERVFEPFFTTKPIGSGTGLGLSICQQIVQAHGGRLELTGPSEFRVTLPVAP